jgi:hypothetical protein
MQATTNRVSDWDGGGMTRVNGTGGGMIEVAGTRAAQEVQAAMVVAKKFPRNEIDSYGRIMKACKRKTLAEQALYAYPKGGQMVTGPSIRLAEAMAQSWGNVDFGIVELEQKRGESTVMAYAWDLETNTRQTKIFSVKHERHTRKGAVDLTDPRDIYELTANQGARRLRACILGVIPGDVVDAAVAECERTMSSGGGEPLTDRIRSMVAAFGEMGVAADLIEKRLGHKVEATTEPELVGLKKIFRSLRDNMASVSDFFDVALPAATNGGDRTASGLAEKLKDDPADELRNHDFDSGQQQQGAGTDNGDPREAWDRWYVGLGELAEQQGSTPEEHSRAFRAEMVKIGKWGKGPETTPEWREGIVKQIRERSGSWAYLQGRK